MDWFRMLLVTFMRPSFVFWMCRINAMTFKSLSRSITIKNEKLAGMLIAYKNTWGISTSVNKRNKLSMLGMISYLYFFWKYRLLYMIGGYFYQQEGRSNVLQKKLIWQ